MNFRYRLMQFLNGIYGIDKLFYGIFGIAAVLAVINLFLHSFVLQMLVYVLGFVAFLRVISHNKQQRLKENRWFTEKINIFKDKYELNKKRKADRLHVYKKCPACKAMLRLPYRQGVHKTTCPRCETLFTVRVAKRKFK